MVLANVCVGRGLATANKKRDECVGFILTHSVDR